MLLFFSVVASGSQFLGELGGGTLDVFEIRHFTTDFRNGQADLPLGLNGGALDVLNVLRDRVLELICRLRDSLSLLLDLLSGLGHLLSRVLGKLLNLLLVAGVCDFRDSLIDEVKASLGLLGLLIGKFLALLRQGSDALGGILNNVVKVFPSIP